MVAWICTPSVKVLSKSLTTIKKNANHFGQNKETTVWFQAIVRHAPLWRAEFAATELTA